MSVRYGLNVSGAWNDRIMTRLTQTESPAVERVSSRPVLALPGTEVGAADVGVPEGAVNIGDLKIDGYGPWVDLAQLLELISRLEAGRVDGALARVIVLLRDRLGAHLAAKQAGAVARAVEVLAAEDLAARSDGVAGHSKDRRQVARRVAVGYLAADRRCSKQRVWRDVALAEGFAAMPVLAAVADQGLLERDKAEVVVTQYGKVPAHRANRVFETGVVGAMVDRSVRAGRLEVERMLVPLLERTTDRDLAARAAAEAGITVSSLGGGMAELRVVDRSENIAVIALAARAAARTAAHHGQPGRLGQLRVEVLVNWARDALRRAVVPTSYGTTMPIEADHGRPVRLTVRERVSGRIVPGRSQLTTWEIAQVGVLTPGQLDSLHDDPAWQGVVEFRSAMAADDPEYVTACGLVVRSHDPPAQVLRMLRARDSDSCRHPACDETADAEDIHHVDSFATTGITTLDGLMMLHATCHREIHQGWHVRSLGGGVFEFTDRDGNVYRSEPKGLRDVA